MLQWLVSHKKEDTKLTLPYSDRYSSSDVTVIYFTDKKTLVVATPKGCRLAAAATWSIHAGYDIFTPSWHWFLYKYSLQGRLLFEKANRPHEIPLFAWPVSCGVVILSLTEARSSSFTDFTLIWQWRLVAQAVTHRRAEDQKYEHNGSALWYLKLIHCVKWTSAVLFFQIT